MNATRTLIIGGAGFTGRALTRRLLELGHQVHVLVRGTVLDISGAIVHTGGLENLETIRHLLPQCQTVVHVASATTPGISARSPVLESDLNLSPTLRFLELLQEHGHIHFIYVSSGGTVYGNPGADLVPEDAPLQPLSYYGAGKVAMETFLRCFGRSFAGRISILRPSNLYGPGQPYYVGFGVIRTMLQHVLDGTTMAIWGDGNLVRDFLHIDDLLDACLRLVQRPEAAGVYNVGAGVGHSLNDLHRVVESVCGRPLHVRHEAQRGIDVQRIVLDTSRIRSQLGWAPQIELEHGIRDTWQWLMNA